MSEQVILYGYCQCGCGQETNIAAKTDRRAHTIKGKPLKFLLGHYAKIQPPLGERFWSKVAFTANPDKCWEWQAYCPHYGRFQIGHTPYLAHRVSWELTNGQIPDGLFVLHKCDSPRCVNPKHLFLGTHQQNMDDMKAKDRQAKGDNPLLPRGEKHPKNKLTKEQVANIRFRYEQGGISTRSLGKEMGVSARTISAIVRGEIWKHTLDMYEKPA